MAKKSKLPSGEYVIGKGRPPKASRWKKGQSGNPKGKTQRPPNEAELIDRLFRRRFPVIEGDEKVIKTGFAIIHTQLLIKEGAGSRRAGRVRDRYEAFARAHAGEDGVLLRYIEVGPTSDPMAHGELGQGLENLFEKSAAPSEVGKPNSSNVTAPEDSAEGKS